MNLKCVYITLVIPSTARGAVMRLSRTITQGTCGLIIRHSYKFKQTTPVAYYLYVTASDVLIPTLAWKVEAQSKILLALRDTLFVSYSSLVLRNVSLYVIIAD